MRTLRTLLVASALGVPGSVLAQDHSGRGGHAPAPAAPASPYTGEEGRAVKALSPEEVADLRAGRGMGLALAAELNGYPGPTHALEVADALDLSADQRERTEAILAAMQEGAVALGEEIVAEEAALDGLFASGAITPEALTAATARIGTLGGELRDIHLAAHLQMMNVLEPEQVAAYARLRGYEGTEPPSPGP
jgi:Spy/CpxP family protein refolding chaperone